MRLGEHTTTLFTLVFLLGFLRGVPDSRFIFGFNDSPCTVDEDIFRINYSEKIRSIYFCL
jgi:hypothetical protein